MSCRKSVTSSLRGLLRRCISSTQTRRAPQSRFIVGNSLFTRCVLPERALRSRFAVASLSSFNFYVMHQRQIRGHPPQLLLDSAVTSSADGRRARPVRLLARLFTLDGPAGLPACHPNNGTCQGLTTRFWIHCWHITNRFAAVFTEELNF